MLVVGGCGFISHAVVTALAAAGHDVVCFTGASGWSSSPKVPVGCSATAGELRSGKASCALFIPEVVVGCVAFNEADMTSLMGTFRGVARRVVALSSMNMYRTWGRFTRAEPGPPEETPFGRTRRCARRVFPRRMWAADDPVLWDYDRIPVERAVLTDPAIEGVVLRLPMVYGPGDYKRRRVELYLDRMAAGKTIEIDPRVARWK